ncbi:hypothetical protein [Streptomyces sp. TRM70350]|uniref:hypothetical protein n=1 Tax=Streptomyces sp. TRM70350 TaxID=2856165 RepID=UPI001C458063|nr:hypothetical protein [Streptomyces sp. TRM70350]MBV7697640.1 hypothetical protein [Streptomyces sp. TRM70350]
MIEPAETPFAVLCDQLGWSTPAAFIPVYEKAAAEVGVSPRLSARQVQRWRTADPPCPHPGRQRVLEAIFGKPLEQLGFDVPPHRRNPVRTALPLPVADAAPLEGTTDPVNRRAFLNAAGGTALGAAVPTHHQRDDPRADESELRIGTDAVTDLRTGLANLYGLDDRYGGAIVGPLAAAHLARVDRLIKTGTYPETIGRQLRLIAGETAEHVGWLAFDAGDSAAARRSWAKAQKRAEELGDASLAVLVMASTSLLSLREGNPREALNLARRASERAKPWAPPTLLSILATREARALATLGDHTAARTTLAHAVHLYEQDRATRPAPEWTTFHGPAELCHAQAHLFTEMGHHGAAVDWLRRSLERHEASYARNEALGRGALASALVRSGEAEEAAHHIRKGQALLTEVSSGRARLALSAAREELARLAPHA